MGKKINIDVDKVLELMSSGATQTQIAKECKCSIRTIQQRIADLRATDGDIVKENIKLAKQKQKLQDLNRIEKKAFREQARYENAILDYNKNLVDILKKHTFPKNTNKFICSVVKNQKSTGVVHITDAHFNELVNLSMNKYDFTIASKRFKLLSSQIKIYFKAKSIKNILVAMTGDLMNSDRRMDELLAESTNRSKGTFLAVCILEQFLLDLASEFHITVASVIGNESRVGKDIGWEESVASDNYDYTIFNILNLIFRNTNVKFLSGNSLEQIVEVSGQNILLIHGNQIKANSVEQSIQKIKGKYTARGLKIDFIIFGHLHSCRTGDTYSRGSSIVGANAYSDSALQLESRASQNIHIFYNNGMRDSIKVDLQNVKDIQGYKIKKELEAYNAKSLKKAQKKVTVSRVV